MDARDTNVNAAAAIEVRFVTSIHQIDSSAWHRLWDQASMKTVFMRHEWLSALESQGCATATTGWTPLFALAFRQGEIVGAMPLYRKSHSWGEYVFDWAWARAYEENDLAYYPKLLSAVPFTPVPGTRLLALNDEVRLALLNAVKTAAQTLGDSSAHVLFLTEHEQTLAQSSGWLTREGVQFHWHNRQPLPYRDFEDFLADLQRDKRKKIAQERRYVREAGVTFRVKVGVDIEPADWDFFYECYVQTYLAHHSTPYLSRSFFTQVATELSQHWLLFIAVQESTRIAASLVAIDPDTKVAYGRYWGATQAIRCLHFEACYYQPLAWCIEHGYERFEGGAQGEHKMARGLMPVVTHSAHWLAHPRFSDAVEDFLMNERQGIANYVDELNEHAPFK